jgi:hypothetical protein
VLSKGCSKCTEPCPYSVRKMSYDRSFIIACQNATLDIQNFRQLDDNPHYNLKMAQENFEFRIFLKRSANTFNFTIDLSLVKNTTGCTISNKRSFELVANPSDFIAMLPQISLSQNQVVSLAAESAVNLLSLLSNPLANLIIGFLQFNKLFFYLSLLNISGGGIYDFINYNFYDKENPKRPWPILSFQDLEFAYTNEVYQSSKLIHGEELQIFWVQVCSCVVIIWCAKILQQTTLRKKTVRLGFQVESFAKKFCFNLSRKYLPAFAISLSYILRVRALIHAPTFYLISFFGLFLMLQFPLMMRYKAVTYLGNCFKNNARYFNTLTSENQIEKNRLYLRANLIEELFFIQSIHRHFEFCFVKSILNIEPLIFQMRKQR